MEGRDRWKTEGRIGMDGCKEEWMGGWVEGRKDRWKAEKEGRNKGWKVGRKEEGRNHLTVGGDIL